jgi:hypothetical protein
MTEDRRKGEWTQGKMGEGAVAVSTRGSTTGEGGNGAKHNVCFFFFSFPFRPFLFLIIWHLILSRSAGVHVAVEEIPRCYVFD